MLQSVIVDGVAYVGAVDNAIYALRTNDGKLLWRTPLDGSVDEPAVVSDGMLYVSSYAGQNGPANVHALRISDGKQVWEYHGDNNYIPSPVLANGLVYISTFDGLVALGASDGAKIWEYVTRYQANISDIINGVVYASENAGQDGPGIAYALGANDGKLLWKYTANNTSLDPAHVVGGVAYVGGGNGMMYALQVSDGKLLWQRMLTGLQTYIQEVHGVLYVLTQKIAYPTSLSGGMTALDAPLFQPSIPSKQIYSYLYALQASSGRVLWQYALNGGQEGYANGFSLDNGLVYGSEASFTNNNADQGVIYAVRSADGSLAWKDEVKSNVNNAQVANGIVYVSSGSSTGDATVLYAVREQDGSLLWSYPFQAQTTGTATIIGSTVYIGADNGMFYALSASDGKLLWHFQTTVSA
jgi:outer membrane protein assembly factor BamB